MQKILKRLCESLFFQAPSLSVVTLKQHFENKTILITGASYGIGEACATLLAPIQCQLVLVARSTDKLTALQKQLTQQGQCQIEIISADLYQPTAAEDIFQHLKAKNIQVDILIHNAGKSIQRSVWESLDRPQDIDRTIHINYINPAQLTRLLLPDLKKAQGKVVIVSTINAKLFAPPLWSNYQASKTAMQQWILSIQPELAVYGVSASLIYLPLVRTRMIEPTKQYNQMPAMQVQHAAQAVLSGAIHHQRQWQPWWLPFASVLSKSFATPIYYFYLHWLKRKQN